MLEGNRIVVFLPNWIGDVVMATPALRALRRHFAAGHICFLGKPAAMETLDGLNLSDSTIADESADKGKTAGLIDLSRKVRKGNFRLAVLLPNSFRSALVARLGGADQIVGYARDGRSWLLSEKISPPRGERGKYKPISAVDYYIALVELLGARCDERKLSLAVTDSWSAAAEKIFAASGVDSSRCVVMLNPGSSFGTSKMWKPGNFAALADMLVERRGAQIVINAAPNEREIARKVAGAMRSAPAINLADQDNTLGLLKAVAARCDILVTNDTGARHIAAGIGTAVVTLFGSTDPRWTTIDFELERQIRVDVPCSPCQQKTCTQRPGPAYHRCMEAITPEMVAPSCLELLDIVAARKAGRKT